MNISTILRAMTVVVLVTGSATLSEIYAQSSYEIELEQQDSLKILSWNIYMLPISAMRGKNFKERSVAITEVVKNLDYDILVFQEAFRNHSRKIIQSRLQSIYPYNYGPANEKGSIFKANSGLWVLSKIPLEIIDEIQFNKCKRADCYARKGAILLEGEFHNKPFQLVATHCQAQPFSVAAYQYRMIYDQLLTKYECEDKPQIICGDMNCEKSITEEYNTMLTILDAEDVKVSGKRKHSYRNRKLRLDYSLFRKHKRHLRGKKQKILCLGPDLNPGKYSPEGEIGISDHYPLEVKIVFEK